MHIETPIQLTAFGDLADGNDQTFAQFDAYDVATVGEIVRRANLFDRLLSELRAAHHLMSEGRYEAVASLLALAS